MHLVSKNQLAARISAQWDSQYPAHRTDAGKIEIGNRLRQLPDTASIEEIDSIIGNQSWTHHWCTNCHKAFTTVAVIPSDEGNTNICEKCANDLVGLFKSVNAL